MFVYAVLKLIFRQSENRMRATKNINKLQYITVNEHIVITM